MDYPVPSAAEMRKVYSEHQPVYDSIAALSFALFDHPKVKELCIGSLSIYPDDITYAFSSCPANKGIDISSRFAHETDWQALVKKIRDYQHGLHSPACIAIYANYTSVPYKKIQETISLDHYKSFGLLRKGAPCTGDSIAPRVCALP